MQKSLKFYQSPEKMTPIFTAHDASREVPRSHELERKHVSTFLENVIYFEFWFSFKKMGCIG